MWAKYPEKKLGRAGFRVKIENERFSHENAGLFVMFTLSLKTSNLLISRRRHAENRKNMS